MKLEELIVGKKYKINKPVVTSPEKGYHWVYDMERYTNKVFTLTPDMVGGNVKVDGWWGISDIEELGAYWNFCLSWLTLVEEGESDQPNEQPEEEEDLALSSTMTFTKGSEENKETLTYSLYCIKDGYMDDSDLEEDMFCKKGGIYKITHLEGTCIGDYLEFTDERGDRGHGWDLYEDDFCEHFILKDSNGKTYYRELVQEGFKGYPLGEADQGVSVNVDQAHNHYFKDCPYDKIDIYRTIELFDITDPCLQHTFKKIACTGKRGHKDINKDVQDIIDTLERWKEMREEEGV